MPTKIENSDLVARFLESIIDVIGRRSSEGYAVVMVNNAIMKLVDKYNFLKLIEIKDVQYTESKDVLNIGTAINSYSPKDIGNALQELLSNITKAIGEAAGYFFIKELKDNIGPDYELALEGNGVDLNLMQFKHVVDKRQQSEAPPESIANVIKNLLQILFDILEEEVNQNFAKITMESNIKKLSMEYDFLRYVTFSDKNELKKDRNVHVAQDINKVEPSLVGTSIEKLLILINMELEERDIGTLQHKIIKYLDDESILSIKKMGIRLKLVHISNELVFRHIMKAIVDVFSMASTQNYAIFAVNTLIKKVYSRYDFLKYIKIDVGQNPDEICGISIMTKLDEIDETDFRRAIQKLLEEAVRALGRNVGIYFVEEFERRLEKPYLIRIEEIGVNLHMIKLRESAYPAR